MTSEVDESIHALNSNKYVWKFGPSKHGSLMYLLNCNLVVKESQSTQQYVPCKTEYKESVFAEHR